MTSPTPRTKVRRAPERGLYDRDSICRILDRHFVAHVGFAELGDDGPPQPFVIPMLYVRDGGRLLLHGSRISRTLQSLELGIPACVSVTLVDGIVLSRAAFDHSVNYRSVVALGTARAITDSEQKQEAAHVLLDNLIPGRSKAIRMPSRKEFAATTILSFDLNEASAKVRQGPPKDQARDLDSPAWAGVIPVVTRLGEPQRDPGCSSELPEELRTWAESQPWF